jgi:hypothetical protein
MKTTNLRITLFLIFIVLSLENYSQEIKRIQNEKFNFSISLPTNWDLIIKENRIKTVGPIPENIVISFLRETNVDLVENFDFHTRRLISQEKITKFKKGSEKINGLEYKWIEFEMENHGFIFQNYLYMTVHKKQLYTIVLTSTKDRFQSYSDVLFKILRTIQMN